MIRFYFFLAFIILGSQSQCSSKSNNVSQSDLDKYERAYFASGCFWCVEAIFESLKGVEEVISGYSGGSKAQANYNDVGHGRSNHAETVEVYYDPKVITYSTLLKVFFASHDPTTLNRQGPDRGRQYRSVIFYRNDEEKNAAENYIQELVGLKAFSQPIVTQVVALDAFYAAEEYHQNYERLHPENPYVQQVSIPRLLNFQKRFPELLKKDHKRVH